MFTGAYVSLHSATAPPVMQTHCVHSDSPQTTGQNFSRSFISYLPPIRQDPGCWAYPQLLKLPLSWSSAREPGSVGKPKGTGTQALEAPGEADFGDSWWCQLPSEAL